MMELVYGTEKWINDYVEKAININVEAKHNFELKLEHTYRVRDNIIKLGNGISLDTREMKLCELLGLLHDIGRFKQYHEFQTFSDSVTGSHGTLGVQMIDEFELLKGLNNFEVEIIRKSIEYHNHFLLPANEKEYVLKFSRLIRDADKLDAFYLETKEDEDRIYDLGRLSDSREYSKEVIEDLVNLRQVDFSNFKYKHDRRLGILGLIFNLYYNESLELVYKEQYVKRLLEPLSNTEDIVTVRKRCNNYIETRLK